MLFSDILIIGAGPAGLSAALAAAGQGTRVTLLERYQTIGGQLVKQTHRFFGSEKQHAGTRGFEIAEELKEAVENNILIDVRTNANVLGIYSDGTVSFLENDKYEKIVADRIIIATGAQEKMLLFEGNDLPGIYGAGAVQTLMNMQGIVPGKSVLMVGAGNIGLIVTYQMLQAGVKVAAVVDAADHIGGYLVHAAKIRRLGVPIKVSTTIKTALGENEVTGAILHQVDERFQPIPGTEYKVDVDTICLSVGLSPLSQLLKLAGCEMKYNPALGGYVPVRDEFLETTVKGVYVAGDVSCVEEASSAMMEGRIAGLSAAISLGLTQKDAKEERIKYMEELDKLRSGKTGEKIRVGLKQLAEGKAEKTC